MSATADRTDPPNLAEHPHGAEIARLRAAANWLESHSDLDGSLSMFAHGDETLAFSMITAGGAEGLVLASKRLGGRWEKDAREGSDLFRLTQQIAPGVRVELLALRDSVCERVVTGTKIVTEPDPDAPMVEREVETYEWRCGSLLAAAGVED